MAVAEVKDGKVGSLDLHAEPAGRAGRVAEALGITPADVTCHVTLLGGGFGRKSKPDYCAEAALLARQVGKPVKVVWTREDDLQFDYFHAPSAQYMKAALDADGMPTAWLQRTAFPPIGSTSTRRSSTAASRSSMGFIGSAVSDRRTCGWRTTRRRRTCASAGCDRWPTSTTRSPCRASPTNSPRWRRRDRVEYLLKLIGAPRVIDSRGRGHQGRSTAEPDAPVRHRRACAASSSWWPRSRTGRSKPAAPGRALGIAAHYSFLSYIAAVVEVEVNARGQVKIPRVDIAVDAGTIVSPDRVHGAVRGRGRVRHEHRAAQRDHGEGRQDRPDQLRQLHPGAPGQCAARRRASTSSRAPRRRRVSASPACRSIAPAIANAIFAATGKRLRELPIRKVPTVVTSLRAHGSALRGCRGRRRADGRRGRLAATRDVAPTCLWSNTASSAPSRRRAALARALGGRRDVGLLDGLAPHFLAQAQVVRVPLGREPALRDRPPSRRSPVRCRACSRGSGSPRRAT